MPGQARPGQTRPGQTRLDQTRPDYTREEQTEQRYPYLALPNLISARTWRELRRDRSHLGHDAHRHRHRRGRMHVPPLAAHCFHRVARCAFRPIPGRAGVVEPRGFIRAAGRTAFGGRGHCLTVATALPHRVPHAQSALRWYARLSPRDALCRQLQRAALLPADSADGTSARHSNPQALAAAYYYYQ